VDAIVVLCGGCLTGILSACELFAQLALHRVVPGVFLKLVPRTGAPYISVICFSVFSGALYASAAGSLVVVSQMFSLVWLTVMALFPISLLLLKFNRGRLRAASRTKLLVVVAALIVVPVVFAGNIAHQPETVGFVNIFSTSYPRSLIISCRYFSAYFLGIVFFFTTTQNKIHLLRWVYWIYDQYPILHRWKFSEAWDQKLISFMTSLRRQPVCILVKTDEVGVVPRLLAYCALTNLPLD